MEGAGGLACDRLAAVPRWFQPRRAFAERGRAVLAPSQTFQTGQSGDLCSLANPSPFSANPANANGASALALCQALMDKSAPGTAATFYANPQFSRAVGPAFAFPSVRGNPTLQPETAETYRSAP